VAKGDPEPDGLDRLADQIISRKDEIDLYVCPLCGWRSAVGDPEVVLICIRCGDVWRPDSKQVD
jgi:uncharacterized C2H2 Zn-finger protein